MLLNPAGPLRTTRPMPRTRRAECSHPNAFQASALRVPLHPTWAWAWAGGLDGARLEIRAAFPSDEVFEAVVLAGWCRVLRLIESTHDTVLSSLPTR